MSLATTLMAVGIPAETANRIGYADRVPLDGKGTTQLGATEILRDNTNIAMGTSVGDTAFILPAETEYFLPYFLLNTTAETALIYPPVGDTIDANALNAAVEIETDLARVFMRVEEGRWVSMPSGEGGGGIESIVAGAGISVDNTDPDNPVVSNTGVLSVSGGAGISVDVAAPQNPVVINAGVLSVSAGIGISLGGTSQNPSVANAGVLSVTAGTNVSITGTAQNPVINSSNPGGTVTAVSVATANGFAGSSSGGATPALTLSTTQTGMLSGNGTALVARTITGTAGRIAVANGNGAGNPTIDLAASADVRDYLDTAPYVPDRTALKALDTAKDTAAILTESGREGVFIWRSGNYSARITSDTQEGVYVKANAVASSAGAWVRQAADTPLWLASWFGTVGDDSTANATALGGAVSAFPSSGGVLILGSGIFRLTTLTINKPIVLDGLGSQGTTVIKSTTLTGDVITVSATGAAVRGIQFDATGNRTSGAYIAGSGASRSHFDLLLFTKYYIGIDFSGCVSSSISRSDFRDGTPGATAANSCGIRFSGTTNTDNRIDTVTMDAAGGSMPSFGILLQNCDATQIVNCDIIHHGSDLQIAPATGQSVAATYAVNSYFDTAENGVNINPSGTGTVLRATFNGCWASSHTNNGFNINALGGGLSMIQFVDCQALFNAARGLLINVNGGDVEVTGGYYNNNTVDGIAVASGVAGFSIVGAQCANNTAQGIWLVGSNDNYRIIGNDLRGNAGAILGLVGNTSTKIIHSNLGVPEVVASKQIATVQGSAVSLSNSSTSAQSVFAAANDTLTVLAATTYRFRARYVLNTGATSHTTSVGFGGTATFTSCNYTSKATSAAANTLAAPQMRPVPSAAAAVITAASIAVQTVVELEGIIRINGAGTIIPQITFSAGPTGTCEVAVDSFFELEPIGNNTVVAVGNWT